MTSTPAVRTLFVHLFDDAAVFPPGLAPVDRAVVEHREHKKAWYADLIGPLLLAPKHMAELPTATQSSTPEVLAVTVIGRPDADPGDVQHAIDSVRSDPALRLHGLEVGWSPGWRNLAAIARSVNPTSVIVVEVPRADDTARAVDDIVRITGTGTNGEIGDGPAPVAKFRTGPTPSWPWPDEEELATFLQLAIDRQAAFKLTGGLHHAIRGEYDGEDQHGLLNVLSAIHAGLHETDAEGLAHLLEERDPTRLADIVRAIDQTEAAALRESFVAYGCCGVTDPIGELVDLGLIKESAV